MTKTLKSVNKQLVTSSLSKSSPSPSGSISMAWNHSTKINSIIWDKNQFNVLKNSSRGKSGLSRKWMVPKVEDSSKSDPISWTVYFWHLDLTLSLYNVHFRHESWSMTKTCIKKRPILKPQFGMASIASFCCPKSQ